MICTYIKLINCDNIIAMTDDGEDYIDKKYILITRPELPDKYRRSN